VVEKVKVDKTEVSPGFTIRDESLRVPCENKVVLGAQVAVPTAVTLSGRVLVSKFSEKSNVWAFAHDMETISKSVKINLMALWFLVNDSDFTP